MNVSLTPELEAFVSQQVEGGMYTSASEVVRHALRLLVRQEQHDHAKLEALRRDIQAGLESGSAGEWDLASFLARAKEHTR